MVSACGAMTTSRISTTFVAIVTITTAGCVSNQAPRPGFWIYVPAPSIDKPRGVLAVVALPAQVYTTNRIDLSVTGQVNAPGAIRAPQGCTVLQAIGYAGGFTDFAFTRRVSLERSSRPHVRLYLRSEVEDRLGHKRVWYAPDNLSRTDYVLEAGDRLHVPRTGL